MKGLCLQISRNCASTWYDHHRFRYWCFNLWKSIQANQQRGWFLSICFHLRTVSSFLFCWQIYFCKGHCLLFAPPYNLSLGMFILFWQCVSVFDPYWMIPLKVITSSGFFCFNSNVSSKNHVCSFVACCSQLYCLLCAVLKLSNDFFQLVTIMCPKLLHLSHHCDLCSDYFLSRM